MPGATVIENYEPDDKGWGIGFGYLAVPYCLKCKTRGHVRKVKPYWQCQACGNKWTQP
jgi:hypothetical protein